MKSKMDLLVFGTCSGTEPQPGRHHVAFAVRHHEKLYWFDAGECCSYTAHLMGVDVRDISAVFISHPHMDHIGGLGNLLWNIRKLDASAHKCDRKVFRLFMPDKETWPSLFGLLKQTEGGFGCRFSIDEKRFSDGIVFEEDGLKVSALHNSHLPPCGDGTYRSFSFLIEADGKRIAYTGDVGTYTEIEPLIRSADVLLAETGHHTPEKICRELNEMGCAPDKLMFIHHGRALLNDPEKAIADAKAIYKGRIIVLNDGDVFHI